MAEKEALSVDSKKKESFFKRKDIEISAKRYLQEALSAMALGLFASLLIGVIFDTIGVQTANLFGDNMISTFFVEVGAEAKKYMGAAIGVAVAWSLKAPPLVLFTSVVTGMMGASMTGFGIAASGGPAGAFIAVALGVEFGKMVSKETKVDILVTPAVTLIVGAVGAKFAGPAIGWCMEKLGDLIMTATEWQPFVFGIVISVIVGLALTAPIQCRDMYNDGSYRACCRSGNSGMLRTDGGIRRCQLQRERSRRPGGTGPRNVDAAGIQYNKESMDPGTGDTGWSDNRTAFHMRVQDDEHRGGSRNGNVRPGRSDRNIHRYGILIRYPVESAAAADIPAGCTDPHHRQDNARYGADKRRRLQPGSLSVHYLDFCTAPICGNILLLHNIRTVEVLR